MFLVLSFIFFFYKIGEQEGGTGSVEEWVGAGTSRSERWKGKGWEDEHGANNVYTCM
jgi:hypothetical protein